MEEIGLLNVSLSSEKDDEDHAQKPHMNRDQHDNKGKRIVSKARETKTVEKSKRFRSPRPFETEEENEKNKNQMRRDRMEDQFRSSRR